MLEPRSQEVGCIIAALEHLHDRHGLKRSAVVLSQLKLA